MQSVSKMSVVYGTLGLIIMITSSDSETYTDQINTGKILKIHTPPNKFKLIIFLLSHLHLSISDGSLI
jgi:hypothetical protein